MDEEKGKTTTKKMVTIGIVFTVDTDEQSIEYKKKISDAVADLENARIDFNLRDVTKRI